MAIHRDLWDGKKVHSKCIANLTVEHLGYMEWNEIDSEYKCTDKPEVEIVYTDNEFMDKLYLDTVKNRKTVRTMTL